MYLNSKQLKAPAWEAMRAAAPSAVLVTLAYILLTSGLSDLVDLFAPTVTVEDLLYGGGMWVWGSLFLTVLLTIYSSVMSFGYTCWALNTARRQEAGYGTLLNGFGMVGSVIWMEIQIFVRVLAWGALIAIVFSLIVGVSAAMSTFLFPVVLFLIVPAVIALYVALFAVMMRYELAPFLLCDYPDDGAGAAVKRSVQMMRGNLWRLFKLYLSFWPWVVGSILLSLLAAGAILSFHLGELMALAGSPDALISQIQLILDAPSANLILLVITLPIDLFYIPYQRISVGNFYRMLSQETVAEQFSGESF